MGPSLILQLAFHPTSQCIERTLLLTLRGHRLLQLCPLTLALCAHLYTLATYSRYHIITK